jgi:hypothetical protein
MIPIWQQHGARLARWWLRRNPTYMLSAAAMALGAKLYLSAPDAQAGDIGRILLTLGILQLYEAAVATGLIILFRARRSPEDHASLMLIAALFWTGPLAATLELTQHHATFGIAFAAAACLIALAEMATVRYAVGLRFSPAGQMVATLCVVLVAAAPAWLRVPFGAPGTDELTLYGCWWLLAFVLVFALPAVRWHARVADITELLQSRRRLKTELLFLVIVAGATALHLHAMNYVFCGHARLLYITPVLAAVTLVGFETCALLRPRHTFFIVSVAILPALGVGLSIPGHDLVIRQAGLPAILDDAFGVALVLAVVCWWFGAVRLRAAALLHLGSGAALLAAIRYADAVPGPVDVEPLTLQLPLPAAFAWILLACAAYLLAVGLLRRTRRELLAALVVQYLGWLVLLLGRTPADQGAATVLAGWTLLALVHAAWSRPTWPARLVPLAVLLAVTLAGEFSDAFRPLARCHGLLLVAVLFAAGTAWRWTQYQRGSAVVAGVWLVTIGVRHAWRTDQAEAAAAVVVAFALLTLALVISWHKETLMRVATPPSGCATEPESPPGRSDA